MADGEARAEFGTPVPGITYAPRPGAYAVITDAEGRVAVMETPRGCFLPGGGIDAGETPAEAAVREVWEETGLRVRAVRLLWEGTYGHGGGTSPE